MALITPHTVQQLKHSTFVYLLDATFVAVAVVGDFLVSVGCQQLA